MSAASVTFQGGSAVAGWASACTHNTLLGILYEVLGVEGDGML